ncbi:MAG: SCO family protein [Bacteroidetes bacterium]|nr:SCO family protein [Bacteroidota bacterium]
MIKNRNTRPFRFSRRYASVVLAIVVGGMASSFRSTALADEPAQQISGVAIDEKLGDHIPMNLVFKDENGNDITLKKISDGKPLIIDMAYYECPGICDVVLAGLTSVLDNVTETPGKDFNVATISFNPDDNPKIAMKKKEQFWGQLSRPFPFDSWRFLTGDSSNIYTLTNSLGFYFKREKDGMYTHPTALIIVDKEGKIIRYIQGTTFAPVDLKMAIMEAKAGTPEQIVSALLCVCFSHTPSGDHLVFNILSVVGISTVVFAAGFIVFLRSSKKFVKNERENS